MSALSIDTIFVGLLAVQFLIIATHDWINLPGWIHGRQVQAEIGRRKLAWATLINLPFPAAALVLGVVFLHAAKPLFVRNYWVLYTAITLGSAIVMWWIPYWFVSARKSGAVYHKMYQGTRHWLPVRHGNAGPNAVHLAFHALFVTTLLLSLVLRLRTA